MIHPLCEAFSTSPRSQQAKAIQLSKPYKFGLSQADYFIPDASENPDRKTLKVCILTGDIVGPIRSGGVGTAFTYLARFLKHHGHNVTILYTLGDYCINGGIDQWIENYGAEGIEFVPLPAESWKRLAQASGITEYIKQSYGSMTWLRERDFDVVHVSEWRGLGYFPLLAKRLGLFKKPPHFVVKCSSPTLWANKGGWQLPTTLNELAYERLERCSVEWADTTISGSTHLLNWMIQHEYELPSEAYSHKNILPLIDEFVDTSKVGQTEIIEEVVFFGQLEPRKGVDLFCRALDFFRSTDVRPKKITFLGKRSPLFNLEEALSKRKDLGIEFEVIDNASQPEAIRILKQPGRLAVMPSVLENSSFCIYECLAYGIPFLASGTGGNPELVAEEHHDTVMFPLVPSEMFRKIKYALENGALYPAPSFSFAENEKIWSDWHYSLAEKLARERVDQPEDIVATDDESLDDESVDKTDQLTDEAGIALDESASDELLDEANEIAEETDVTFDDAPADELIGETDEANEADEAPEETIITVSELPLISVCMSSYNRAHCVRRALQSVRAQTYPNIEIVVVDDGSPDPKQLAGMYEIAEELAQEGHKLIVQDNLYLGAVRNRSAAESKGEFILFMDDDNIALPNEVETLYNAMQKSGCDILTTYSYLFIEDDDGFQSYDEVMSHDFSGYEIIPFLGGGLSLGLFKNVFGDSNCMVRRKAFEEVGGFNTDYGVIPEDHEFFVKCILAGKQLLVYPEPMYLYRWSFKGMMRSTNANPGRLRVARIYSEYIPRELEQIIYMAQSQFFENNKNANFVRLMKPWIESIGEVSELMKNMTKKG